MMSLEEYKRLNYKMVVQYNSKEKSYFVEFPELPGCMADAETVTQAVEKALKAKDEWLEVALESGYKVPVPVEKPETTGRQTVRMPKSLHARVIERAEEEGVSQNQLILTFIAEGLQGTETRDLSTKVIGACQEMIKQVSENTRSCPIMASARGPWLKYAATEGISADIHYVLTPHGRALYQASLVATVAQSGTSEIQSTGFVASTGVYVNTKLAGFTVGEHEERPPLALVAG
jgi:antitoxin HicB